MMDAVSGLFLQALGTDMTAMEEYFPFVSKAFTVMQYTAWALLFLITVWQLFCAFGGPVTEAENPWVLLGRSALFAFLIGYAKPIFLLTLKIATAPYTALMDIQMTAEDFTFAGIEQALQNGLTSLIATISVVGLLLLTILEIALGWNYFKLLLETVERYIVVSVLCYTSPLAFSMGASKATTPVFRSWCRMVGSQLLLLVMNVWFLRGFANRFKGNSYVRDAVVDGPHAVVNASDGSQWYQMECIILSVKEAYMDAQEVMHMTDYSKITALYSRLSVGDEDRDGGESNSIQNQKIFLENYARGQHLTNIRHYIDDDESGRFFDRSAYSRMMDDVENGKIGVCIMKDLTRWGRDYLQVGNAMEIFRRNNVRFIAVNNGIDSEKPDTLEFAPFINIMSEWYAKDISKKVKTGIKTKGMSGKPIATEAPYGYVKSPDNKDFWIIDEEAAGVVRLIFRLFLDGKNRNQIAVYLTQAQIPTPTFYMKERGRGTCKNRALNEANRYKWNKATLTHILTRQEYCGDVVNFKTTKHFRDKRNHYVDRSQWQITENVHEPIIDRTDFETVQRILENAPVKRPNGDGEIHPLSGLLFCKDCGAKMHIRIDYRNGGKRHVAYCSEYHKGKAKNPKCNSPHIIDADLLMQTIAEVLKKIEDYSISNWAEFEALVKKNLAMQQTDKTKKQQKRIPQITTRLEQIDKVLNKLYEDNALGTIPQDRYEQMSQKYSEEYYALKAELAELQEQLSAFENAGGRAQKFLKLTERYAAFTDLTPAILNEFISRIEVHERDKKRAKQAIQHIGIYFNYIGKFENEVTQLTEPTEQEIRQMREKIEEAQKEKSRAYHRQYSREYRARNLEKRREYDRMKAREYRAKKKAQEAAAAPAQ